MSSPNSNKSVSPIQKEEAPVPAPAAEGVAANVNQGFAQGAMPAPFALPGDDSKGFAPGQMPAFKNILDGGAVNFDSTMVSNLDGDDAKSMVPSVMPSNMNFDDKNDRYVSDFDDGASEIHMSELYGADRDNGPTSENIEAMRHRLW